MRSAARSVLYWAVLAGSVAACSGAQATGRGAPAGASACAVGDYVGTGTDEAGTAWQFELALRPEGDALAGVFHWRGSNGSIGEEQIRGRVDCASGALDWQGVAASGGSGDTEIVAAHYTGTFDGARAGFAARWTGGTPGVINGRRR